MSSLRPQAVSRYLRGAGHRLVHPDGKRDGVSVARWDSDHVVIRFQFSVPNPHLALIIGDVIRTVMDHGELELDDIWVALNKCYARLILRKAK